MFFHLISEVLASLWFLVSPAVKQETTSHLIDFRDHRVR